MRNAGLSLESGVKKFMLSDLSFKRKEVVMVRRIFGILFVFSLIAAIPIHAADFPTKEVQIIIPWAAGGATDLIFRALAATTGKYLGKAVVVVNRPGGGSAVGYTEGAQAKPDGYTLTSAVTPLTILPHQVTTALLTKILNPSSMW